MRQQVLKLQNRLKKISLLEEQEEQEEREMNNMAENELVLFEQKSLAVMQELRKIKEEKERLEKIDADLRSKLQVVMDEYGVTNFKNDYVTISNVAPTESVTVDLKKLKENEPECYEGLIEDYPKVTKRKGYVKILVK